MSLGVRPRVHSARTSLACTRQSTICLDGLPYTAGALRKPQRRSSREAGMNGNREGKVAPGKRGRRLSKAWLDELVEEALVDAYGESEQATGFYTMIENDLCPPFETEMLGVMRSEDDQLVAVCRKGKDRQRILLTDLPLPKTLPKGGEWIVAYRYWRTGAM